jgi:hypothetical protein
MIIDFEVSGKSMEILLVDEDQDYLEQTMVDEKPIVVVVVVLLVF